MKTKKLKFHPKLKQERKMKLMCVQWREFQLCAAGTIFFIYLFIFMQILNLELTFLVFSMVIRDLLKIILKF